ncbi:MAG TPA: hypothetical protein VL832_06275 [Puia sp.]|jgi:hypothetical protein|nr:hypothetical protein [Puia sp.]
MTHSLHQKKHGRDLLAVLALVCFCGLFLPKESLAQTPEGKGLEKMPADLETALALSALPLHLRSAATVYLLDPTKGFYVARKGTNGFSCLISRTEWEWGKFRNDLFAPMGFDPEGVRTIFPIYRDEAAMRASGKFTARQVKDTILNRIRKGIYKAPARGGICYMLAPIMRVYTGNPGDESVKTMNMPHYMFYAPYTTNADVGTDPNSENGPWMVNPDETVLGGRKTPYGYLIMPANEKVTAKIISDGKDLLRRLADYSPYFKTDAMVMHH